MKIISWNVNGFRSAMKKGVVEDLLVEYDPDLLFIQELKCTEQEFLDTLGTHSVYICDNYVAYADGSVYPGRFGVALLAKNNIAIDDYGNQLIEWYKAEIIDPKLPLLREGRLQVFVINDILMINTYSVRVSDKLEGLDRSLQYNDHLLSIIDMWRDLGKTKVLVIGDLNLTPTQMDQHERKTTMPILGMTEEQRYDFTVLFNLHDLHDTFRVLHPDRVKFSYWSYRTFGRETERGYRLDYALVSTDLLDRVVSSDILTFVLGSDHAPIILELREE